MTQPPIYYFARMLPAYRHPVMERLNERLDGRLVVCYGQPPEGNPVLMKPVEGDFRKEVLRNYWYRDTTVHAQFYRSIFKKHGPPEVLLAEESPRSITLPWLLRRAAREGAARVLWGIFYSVHRPLNGTYYRDRARIAMAGSVEACACYSRQSRDYLARFIPSDRLFVAQNTLDTDTLFRLHDALAQEGRERVRRRLGLPGDEPVFVFMAQLVPRKGTRDLLEVFDRFRAQQPGHLIVIGGGPDREPMEQIVRDRGLAGVHFLGAMPRFEQSAPYLFAADAMVNPGYVGLAVNHAFSFGLPIITQEPPDGTPFHGPEVESITHGENGFIVAHDGGEALLDAMRRTVSDRDFFSRNALAYAREHLTMDHMLDGIVAAINHARDHRKQS